MHTRPLKGCKKKKKAVSGINSSTTVPSSSKEAVTAAQSHSSEPERQQTRRETGLCKLGTWPGRDKDGSLQKDLDMVKEALKID